MGVASIVCAVFLVIHVAKSIISFITLHQLAKKRSLDLPEKAKSLSNEEKKIVIFCVLMKQQSVYMPLMYPAANALKQKGFLQPAAGLGDGRLWAFSFNDEAWKVILEEFRVDEQYESQIKREEWFQRLRIGQTDWKAWEDTYWKYRLL